MPRQSFPKYCLGLGLIVSQVGVEIVRLCSARLASNQRLRHSVLDRPRLHSPHQLTPNPRSLVSLIDDKTADFNTPIRLQELGENAVDPANQFPIGRLRDDHNVGGTGKQALKAAPHRFATYGIPELAGKPCYF